MCLSIGEIEPHCEGLVALEGWNVGGEEYPLHLCSGLCRHLFVNQVLVVM